MSEIKNNFIDFLNIDRNLLGAALFAITKTNEVYKVDLESNAVIELRNMILDVLNGIVNNEDMSFMDISTVDDRQNVVYVYDDGLAFPEDLAEIQAKLNNESNLEDMDFTQIQMSDIKMFIVHTGIDTNKLYLYQFVSNVNIYRRDKFFFKKDRHRLIRIDDDMVRITSKIQMAQLGDKLAIFELEQFEKMFKFHDVIKQEAASCMNKIQEMQLIENVEDFEDIVNDVRYARKIVRAIRNSPVIKLGISNSQIIDF
ncbi:Kiwa anti-phage protein KwaB-like domain-containing protein, partial [Campylobacter coli]